MAVSGFLVVSILIAIAGDVSFTRSMYLYIAAMLSLPIAVTLWLLLLNSGKSRIDECFIEIKDSGIEFQNVTEAAFISSEEMVSYKVSGLFLKSVTIKGRKSRVVFELDLFSKDQQRQILQRLDELI